MNISSFLQCLTVNGIVTGSSIQGIYTFNSGDSNLIYNNLYPTGAMYYSGIVSTINTPLINVGQSITNSYFSGLHNFRIGYSSSNDFGLLLDIQYDSCSKKNMVDYCLLSSYTSNNSGKNFTLSINDANRLSFKSSGGYYHTLGKELTNHDFVYFSLSQHQYVTFGIYNVGDSRFYSKRIDLGGANLNSDIVYIGSEFSGASSTGFFGTISNAVLFNQPVSNMDTCVNCYFTTGYTLTNTITTVNVPLVTGIYYSGISGDISLTSFNSGNIPKVNGSNVNVEFINQSTTGILTGLQATLLYSSTGVNVSQPFYQFFRDTGIINSYSKYNIGFTYPLQSGDALEIYTYYYPIPNLGTRLIGYDISNVNGIMQLINNGVDETLNVDYTIVRNQVSGFFDNDVLNYDILNAQSVIVNFSGSLTNPFTGTNAGANSLLYVTGVSGVNFSNPNYPKFGYDVFLNGQKLISGYEYSIQNTGVSGANVIISGTEIMNPDLSAIDTSELAFIPQFNNFLSLVSGVTQSTPTFSGFGGFSEQIWVNGIRQNKGLDYWVMYPCASQSGSSNVVNLPYLFYNNDSSYWNFSYPVKPTGATGVVFIPSGTLSGYLDMNVYWPTINVGAYASGNYLEVLSSINSGVSGLNYISTNTTGYKFTNSGTGHGQNICIQLRYKNGNIISEPSPINCFSY